MIEDTAVEETADRPSPLDRVSPPRDESRARYNRAMAIGTAVAAVPSLWFLWVNWSGRIRLLPTATNDEFFDAQAKAIMHGRLWVPPSTLDIEAFHHGGHSYTYFGIFPSLLRIPFLFVDSTLSGRLTGPSYIAAWLLIAFLFSHLLWRVRTMVRGDVLVGRLEAASYGVLVALLLGGSVILFLVATPWVYDEDIAWGICLSIGALYAMLGVLERPSARRVLLLGGFLLAGGLDRLSTGYACVFGAFLVAAWFALGRSGDENRRWAVPVAGVALVALIASASINYLKFGVPFGLPLSEQQWTVVNAHRRAYLRHTGNRGYGPEFLPTTLWTYFQPLGIRFQSVFPFVTLPATIPRIIGGAYFDQTYRTASVPASMPLLFLLTVFGVIANLVRRHARAALRLFWIPLLATAACFGLASLWGYMAPRFEGDIMPLLALGGAMGVCHLWEVFGRRRVRLGRALLGAAAALAVFEFVACVGITAMPTLESDTTQVKNFVSFQKTISDVTGHPLNAYVRRSATVPYYAPAGTILIVGDCAGFYYSNGENFRYELLAQRKHRTWTPIEPAPHTHYALRVVLRTGAITAPLPPIPLLRSGGNTLAMEVVDSQTVKFLRQGGPGGVLVSNPVSTRGGATDRLDIYVDTNLHLFSINVPAGPVFDADLTAPGPVTVYTHPAPPGQPPPAVAITEIPTHTPGMPLCRSLLKST